MRFIAVIFALLAGPASAATVLQEIDYIFIGGALAGTTVEVRYSYPTLPAGQMLESYSPSSIATATYLDASAEAEATLIFSGGVDVLTPEPYISFAFDPAANSTGLISFDVWSISNFGIYFEADPDIQAYSCGEDVECVFRTAVVPLPAGGWLLLAALAGAAGVSRRATQAKNKR